MKRIRKIFIMGIISISIIFAISFVTVSKFRLDKPYFFNMVAEYEVYEDEIPSFFLNLRYIANGNDHREISSVQLFDSEVSYYESVEIMNIPSQVEEFYKYFDVRIHMVNLNENIPKYAKVTEAIVHFDDGTVEEVKFEEVSLVKSERKEESNFEMMMTSFNENDYITEYQAKEDIVIKSFQSQTLEKLSKDIEVTVNGVPYKYVKNFEVSKGDSFTIETRLSEQMNTNHPLTNIIIRYELIYDLNGIENHEFLNFNHIQYESHSFVDLHRQMKEGGGR